MFAMFKKTGPLLAALLLLTAAAGAQAGKEVTTDGVLHVMNGATPAEGVVDLKLEEAWRAGGEDSEDFFGLITQAVIGDDGSVYLLDTRLSEVPVYSPDGERVTTLSHEGEGPGETRNPTNLLKMPDGSLGLVQMFPGKITMIDTEGTPRGEFKVNAGDPTAGGFMMFFDVFSGSGQLLVTGEAIAQKPPTGQLRTNFVASYDVEGHELTRFHSQEREMDFTRFEFVEDEMDRVDFRKACVGTDGRVYLAPVRNKYLINVYRPDGALDRVIEREFTHRPRSDKDYEAVKTAVEAQLAQLPNAVLEVSRTEPDIGGLHFGTDGNLWVTSSRSGFEQPEGVLSTYDVFSPDGHFIKQVRARCPGNGLEDTLFFTPGGDAVMVTGFTSAVRAMQGGGAGAAPAEEEEAKPMEVIYYKAS